MWFGLWTITWHWGLLFLLAISPHWMGYGYLGLDAVDIGICVWQIIKRIKKTS